ncbi:MAG: Na+/H+ antiporter subunit E [Acidimicrobiaceae bacterium]|nr:Na+/H+ antiporter subunit E [Acidimicrobiaceae bacterium]
MPPGDQPLAGAGNPRRSAQDVPVIRRVGSWLVWWVLLMSLWILIDDTLALAELLAGAAVAAMAALLVEAVAHQADTRFRIRIEWVQPAFRLPVDLVRDTLRVFGALWRRLARGEEPRSGFRVVPVAFGDDTPEGVTRRVLLVGGRSLAPNTFVLGIDKETNLIVIHQLVIDQGDPLDSDQPQR